MKISKPYLGWRPSKMYKLNRNINQSIEMITTMIKRSVIAAAVAASLSIVSPVTLAESNDDSFGTGVANHVSSAFRDLTEWGNSLKDPTEQLAIAHKKIRELEKQNTELKKQLQVNLITGVYGYDDAVDAANTLYLFLSRAQPNLLERVAAQKNINEALLQKAIDAIPPEARVSPVVLPSTGDFVEPQVLPAPANYNGE